MKKLILYVALGAMAFNAQSQDVVQGEYFIDSDPGFGHATQFVLSPGSDIKQNIEIPYNAFPSPGYHVIFFRIRDANGNWGFTGKRLVDADENKDPLSIIKVEYFFNADNGFGNNTFALFNVSDSNTWNFEIPFDQLPGSLSSINTLFLRVQDNNRGHWSQTSMIDSINYIMVGFNELEQKAGIAVFPNPFTDEITVALQKSVNMTLILYDELGQIVLNKVIGQTTTINTSNLSPGVYALFLFTDKNTIFRSAIIKQ